MGVEGLAPILSTQEEKVNFWGKKGLEKGISGGGGMGTGDGGKRGLGGTCGRLKIGVSLQYSPPAPASPSPHKKKSVSLGVYNPCEYQNFVSWGPTFFFIFFFVCLLS